MDKEFASVEQTAEMFGIGRTSLFKLIKDGRIEVSRLKIRGAETGMLFVKLQSVRDLLHSCVVKNETINKDGKA